MKERVIAQNGERVFAVVFDKGDEVVSELTAFAKNRGITAAHFTAIGAFQDVVLGYFDRTRKDYKRIVLREQVEVLMFAGDVALQDGQPKIHGHVVVGTSEGAALGGHLLEAHVWPTLEVILEESPSYLRRTTDHETGLALIDLTAS